MEHQLWNLKDFNALKQRGKWRNQNKGFGLEKKKYD